MEYLADRDERWRAFLAPYLDAARPSPAAGVLAVFDASRAWSAEHSGKGCSMVNAHAEISDPSHPAYAIITAQKEWMLALFTDLVRAAAPGRADRLGRALMLLHEGALVAHGLGIFPDPIGQARDEARTLLAAAGCGRDRRWARRAGRRGSPGRRCQVRAQVGPEGRGHLRRRVLRRCGEGEIAVGADEEHGGAGAVGVADMAVGVDQIGVLAADADEAQQVRTGEQGGVVDAGAAQVEQGEVRAPEGVEEPGGLAVGGAARGVGGPVARDGYALGEVRTQLPRQGLSR